MTDKPMTEEQLRGIEGRERKATPGEWGTYTNLYGRTLLMIPFANDPSTTLGQKEERDCMVFAAHARTDIPTLVNEVRRLRALIQDASPHLLLLANIDEDQVVYLSPDLRASLLALASALQGDG